MWLQRRWKSRINTQATAAIASGPMKSCTRYRLSATNESSANDRMIVSGFIADGLGYQFAKGDDDGRGDYRVADDFKALA